MSDDPPLLSAIYGSISREFEAARVKAASGFKGCRAARRKMIALRAELLRLELPARRA